MLVLFIPLVLTTCADDASSSSDDDGAEKTGGTVTLTEVPKSNIGTEAAPQDSFRDRWGLFEVSADGTITGYKFGVKASSDPAPTASDMENDLNVKKYNLDTSPITIILATRMASPMLGYFDGLDVAADNALMHARWTDTALTGYTNTKTTLTGTNEYAFRNSMLLPETSYTIYGLHPDKNTIDTLGTFTTTAVNTNYYSGNTSLIFLLEPILASVYTTTNPEDGTGAITTLTSEGRTITFHKDNYEIFPWQFLVGSKPPKPFLVEVLSDPNLLKYTFQDSKALEFNSVAIDTSYPNFWFYVGDFSDYDNDETLMFQNAGFMVWKNNALPSSEYKILYTDFGDTNGLRIQTNIQE